MVSPYRFQPNNTNKRTKKTSNTFFDNNSNRKLDVKKPRFTSFDLKTTSKECSSAVKPVKIKNKLKKGGKVEINEEYLDEILHKSDLKLDLAIQFISNVKKSQKRYCKKFKKNSTPNL